MKGSTQMNYYGINRKVNMAGYIKGYKGPSEKQKENEIITRVMQRCNR